MARGPVLVFLSLLLLTDALTAQELPINGVNGYSLHPPYFNLAEGTKITATATCGVDESQQPIQDLYCKLVGGPVSGDPSQTIQGQYCDICSSEDTNRAHPINNAIDGTERWWQSPPLSRSAKYNEVNVTLDLGQLFHVAYVLIKFANSPRPDLWVLEHSIDFGKTYKPWKFFASSKRDCIEQFGQRTIERITHDDDIICTTEYSRIVPLENGEIVVSLVNGRPGAMNFSYSPVLREFTKATNIRLRFLRTNTLLGHLMGKALRDPTVTRRYYYSIKDISIGGRCVCNGHAEACNCACQHNTCGLSCDRCCPGFNQFPWKPATTYSANECEPCNCHRHSSECYYDPEIDQRRASLNMQGKYSGGGVCVECQHHTTGNNCERCIPGYYRSPDHSLESPFCQCESEFTDGTCEDLTGRCYCKPNYTGENCDTCAEGYEAFPECYRKSLCVVCTCDPRTSLDSSCTLSGQCNCRPNYSGPKCEQCAPGYYSYPSCTPCRCSVEGSRLSSCDPVSGQCVCLPNIVGQRCDSCSPGSYGFPLCQGDLTIHGSCNCRPHVEGVACDRCKPLYWNLSLDTVYGCSSCDCNTLGTMSEVAECTQSTGQCYCKPNVCSGTCNVCKDGYFNLQKNDYFGCQGCQCDIGGSVGQACDERRGRCRCRPNVEGPKCKQPRPDHYFPDLHHMKFEVEEGTTMDGRPVRFGYNPLEFESFSWRGYAQMSPIQVHKHTRISLHLEIYFLNFISEWLAVSNGKITAYQNSRRGTSDGSEQSKQIVFAPTSEPTFVSVPQNSFVEPFVLNPGTWTVIIEAEGILLDYLVLLPSAYYEAPILQLQVTEPCSYSNTQDSSQNCLQYMYLSLDEFPSISSNDASCRSDNHLPRPCHTEKITPRHPSMAICSGNDVRFGLSPFSSNSAFKRVAVFTLSTEADILLTTDKMFLIPRAQFTMEYLKPRNAVMYSTRVHALGRYVFILHYHQPLHPTYNVQVHINGGRIWQGHVNASFCPHGYGCRSVVMSESQIILDVTDYEVILTLRVPDRKTLWLVSDYVLVVPESTYSSSFLSEEPLDKSYDFISNCGQNSFYINPSTASPFCRNSAVSLSAFFNNGAVPCGCHEVGAESDTCETFGGQCKCRPNVIGRDCSQCATGYYGFPNCRPCNCGSRLCEPVTGECICPPRTLQPDCVTCEPQTFGCHPLVGCEMCNCSRPGVASLEVGCDTHNGQCRCRNNIVGRQCDRCAPGFYGYPNCRPCDCSEAGTEKDVCDSITGRCLCKENVEGSRCDQCKLGTFHLDPTNTKGCTKCFCFGATDRCHSSDKRRSEIMDMAGWVLLRSDRQEVPVSTYLDQDLVEADLSDVPDVSQDLHWHAPHAYLGDKVSSYGGYLRYRLHTQTMRGDAFLIVETTRPDVILKVLEQRVSFSQVYQEFLLETGNSVSREELMMVLVALESLQIRALHSQSAQSVSLRAAVLEGADNLPSGRHANNVEICLCPGHYLGDSCQKCAPGYYRDTKGLFLGKCVPCNCNGHSDECVDGSGICVNCRHNTAGNHCEQCLGGFHGNNTVDGHAVSCSSCPCPLQVASNKCAPGYYGNPMVIGSTCQPCNCNGNSDPNMLFSDCHPLTGECQSCMHNSAGPHCEICAPGFYGDAITAKNCTRKTHLYTIGKKSIYPIWMVFHVFRELSTFVLPFISATCVFFFFFKIVDLVLHSCCLSVVVDRVQNEIANRTLNNEAVAENIRNKLNQFNQQLMDLRDAMNEAVKNTANATEANNINEKRMEDSLSSFLYASMLCRLYQDYERLAAQLDGARQPLAEKVQKYAPSASKIPLVEAAEKHAEMLDQLAKNLSRYNGFIQRALNASRAYTDITNSVLEAETAAKKANEAATENIKDKDLPKQAAAMKNQSNELVKEAEELNNSSQSKNSTKDIAAAKSAVEQANNTVANVSNTLAPIQKQLEEWQKQYGDSNATGDDINKALNDANTSVAALSDTLPQLMKKLDRLQNTSFQPSNISDSIQRIRQLIKQARNAANKVSVSMQFNGNSGVQVRTPTNVADLAAYSSLQMYIKLPRATRTLRQTDTTKPQFVLYLGNKDVSQPPQPNSDLYHYDMLHPPSDLNMASPNFFKGCLELLSLNEELVSLYNFEEAFQMNTTTDLPCSRSEGFIYYLLNNIICVNLFARVHSFLKSLCVYKQEEASKYARVGRKDQRTMTLSVFDGDLMLTVNGGKKKNFIRSKKKYNDGLWHTVRMIHDFRHIFVLVFSPQISYFLNELVQVFTYLCDADFPVCLCVPIFQAGFVGCVRDLNLNEVPSQSPSHSVGVTPCYQQPLQPGVYFSSQGGYLTIDESLVLARDLEIQLEVRLVSDSGLLLHAGAKKTQQLSLYLNQGQVTVLVNSGSGEFSVSLTPEESLCDGGWHTIASESLKTQTISLHLTSLWKPKTFEFNIIISISNFTWLSV
uniref:Laminin, alpha 5 n=1 Tax=Cyprinus carpio TaxID=7962 RepID=A0A8C1MCI5_CYPCA